MRLVRRVPWVRKDSLVRPVHKEPPVRRERPALRASLVRPVRKEPLV